MDKSPGLCGTPHLAGKQMSTSLKERLRRLGRLRYSPLSVSQEPTTPNTKHNTIYNSKCISPQQNVVDKHSMSTMDKKHEQYNSPITEMNESVAVSKTDKKHKQYNSPVTEMNELVAVSKTDTITVNVSTNVLHDSTSSKLLCRLSELQGQIAKKEDILRKLKMVKVYRLKNDPATFEQLIVKWRRITQEAVQDLHQRMPEPRPLITDLINHLQIDHKLLGYVAEDMTFDYISA
ncbi:swi5-dependent recombination DNA repair protein 1 homolog [Limulus polyphemus]|uniref:Swi5-dependent recombination DNA repair protein 1 homolog n=1 Tax=Limulus polyphemus TaxID=6850 RepID=A0ABM1S5U0_LIMPO|nr:swi5-dependent recombination DNA repair protein 1 homolog [Limulus polyphemus]